MPGRCQFRRSPLSAENVRCSTTLRRLLSLGRPYALQLAIVVLLTVLEAVAAAIGPLGYRVLVDKGIEKHDQRLVVLIAAVLAVLAVLAAGLTLCERWIASRISHGVIADLRNALFEHLQRMPVSFFGSTQEGALMSRINNDVMGAQQAFNGICTASVGNIATCAVTLLGMSALSWKITIVSVGLAPTFIILARWTGRRIAAATRDSYSLMATLNNILAERLNVAGAVLVKMFNAAGSDQQLMRKENAELQRVGIRLGVYQAAFAASLMLLVSLATSVVYGWGGLMAARGSLSVGTVVALSLYLSRLYGPMNALAGLNVELRSAGVSLERIFEVIELAPAVMDKPGALILPRGPANVVFQEVCFGYPHSSEVTTASLRKPAPPRHERQQVLFNISFEAQPGQLLALVGPSGAGKSTIGYLVARLYDVTSGSVRIAGVDVRDVARSALSDAVGLVTQDAYVLHDTIRENLRYAKPGVSDECLVEALDKAQLLDLLSSLPEGLDTVVGGRGYRLSGGERQRLAIARVLLRSPSVVVLDEPTAHLDSGSERRLEKALSETLSGRTAIVIAHRLSTVRRADQILVLSGGSVVERGRHTELVKLGGLYAQLYNAQSFSSDGNRGTSRTRRGVAGCGGANTSDPLPIVQPS